MCSVGAWVRGWSELNFCMSRVGRVGPQNFGVGQKKWQGQNFGVGETCGFMNFYYDSAKFYL